MRRPSNKQIILIITALCSVGDPAVGRGAFFYFRLSRFEEAERNGSTAASLVMLQGIGGNATNKQMSLRGHCLPVLCRTVFSMFLG